MGCSLWPTRRAWHVRTLNPILPLLGERVGVRENVKQHFAAEIQRKGAKARRRKEETQFVCGAFVSRHSHRYTD